MEIEKMDDNSKNALCLAFLYATSWQEESKKRPGKMIRWSFKVNTVEILLRLEDLNYIRTGWNSNRVQFTSEGEARAKRCLKGFTPPAG